ncbi:MAG: tetrathionate reductase family octaheme c-type cytochrome [Deltaproteobacteria bacterium]|nr:tetrathionate reductase family octaheme c-type cytochrome [Deltaproteobacteria bacterium]
MLERKANAKHRRALLVLASLIVFATGCGTSRSERVSPKFKKEARAHFDHASVISGPFKTAQAVTRACLKCHTTAASDFMKTSHWTWLSSKVKIPGRPNKMRIGKKNLINNFCISVSGNQSSCTKCHAGYGWADDSFDFKRQENVDCLVCHERSGSYVKGAYGVPSPGTDLVQVAKSVGFPKRENCATCHNYGGGGQGVKHGDLDSTLENPYPSDDVHMGRYDFLCIDCHRAQNHNIPGRAFSVSVEHSNGLKCTTCHEGFQHTDRRINSHLQSVACQTCHIPAVAKKLPTKIFWDWSKAGDKTRVDDEHNYLRIKGEFVYDAKIVPEYYWFNLSMDRYLVGDRIKPEEVTPINRPLGDIRDPKAQIWPFKVHRALQHYDKTFHYLLTPMTAGKGGYWSDFDWDQALRLGAKASNLKYSGAYGFTRTEMFWPLSHMVAPAKKALACQECHGQSSRLDWKALGYEGDPVKSGGRR